MHVEWHREVLPVADFEIPRSSWQSILDALSPSELDTKPQKWTAMGSLRITVKGGGQLEFMLFYISSPRLGAFAAGSIADSRQYYRGGSSERLKVALAEAYANSKEGNGGNKGVGE
jgi:hypothetical protein